MLNGINNIQCTPHAVKGVNKIIIITIPVCVSLML